MAGCLSSAIGLSLTLLRADLPTLLGYTIANFFTFYAWFLFYIALEYLVIGRRSIGFWVEILAILHCLVFTWIADSPWKQFSGVYVGIAWTILNLFLAYRVWLLQEQVSEPLLKLMTYLYLGGSFVWMSRIFLSQAYGFNFVTDGGFTNWLTLLINTLLVIARQITYIFIRLHAALSENSVIKMLTEEKDRLMQSLVQANKASSVGALAASIAHELNQPLGASLLNIQFMKMLHDSHKLSPEMMGELISQLERDAKRAGDIVKSLQSIFVKDGGAYEEFDIGEVIDTALAIYKSELISSGIQLQVNVSDDLKICAHKGQFLQVLLNLINNAMQILVSSNPERKLITIAGSQNIGGCTIRIMDSGPGLSKDRRDHLFELFGSDKQAGMGVGLWLCSYIMSNFGGRIAYEDNPNGGATFVLTLPEYSPES